MDQLIPLIQELNQLAKAGDRGRSVGETRALMRDYARSAAQALNLLGSLPAASEDGNYAQGSTPSRLRMAASQDLLSALKHATAALAIAGIEPYGFPNSRHPVVFRLIQGTILAGDVAITIPVTFFAVGALVSLMAQPTINAMTFIDAFALYGLYHLRQSGMRRWEGMVRQDIPNLLENEYVRVFWSKLTKSLDPELYPSIPKFLVIQDRWGWLIEQTERVAAGVSCELNLLSRIRPKRG